MSRIGSTIRSANRKAITPPKLDPEFHKTAARGTLPTEQTKVKIATSGPTSGPTILEATGSWVANSTAQTPWGTQAATAPEISRPPPMSTQSMATSDQKKWLMAVKASAEKSR